MEPKIVTMDSRSARILCTDRKGHYPIVAAILESDGSEGIWIYNEEGCAQDTISTSHDLFFADLDPEPTYRPYKDVDECFKDVVKHGGWVKSKWAEEFFSIGCVGDGFVVMCASGDKESMNGNVGEHFDKFLENNVYADDGSPCGVKEG